MSFLEEHIEERTHDLQTLLDLSNQINATLDFESLINLIFEELERVVGYDGLTILMADLSGELTVAEYRGPLARQDLFLENGQFRAPIELLYQQDPVVIPDVHADTRAAAKWRKGVKSNLGQIPGYISSLMSIPLFIKNQATGVLVFDHSIPGYYTRRHAELASALANNAAVAIQNARLFRTIQRGADQFRVISELGQRITLILNIEELLSETAHLIQSSFGYYHVHIGLMEGDHLIFPAKGGVYEDQPVCNECSLLRLNVDPDTVCGLVASTGTPLIVPDIPKESRYLHPKGAIGSGVVVPLIVKGQVIGLMDVENKSVSAFDESDVAVLQLLANQVAVAIENARLYEKARKLVVLQERQRISRELHDSVSQALYGIGLGARTARALLDKDPHRVGEALDYVLSLAEAGLAEMRALIFELRPEMIETDGLLVALENQLAALSTQHQIQVKTDFDSEPDLPVEEKQALYRIIQEALNNTMKHAKASLVEVCLKTGENDCIISIRDNGQGFNLTNSFPGHFGLHIMRERTEHWGGTFAVESEPGRGTLIRLQLPYPDIVRAKPG